MIRVRRHRKQVLGIPVLILAGSLMLAFAVAIGAPDAWAQEGGGTHAHPAHIHVGTCDELDPNPTFMLIDVALAATETGAAADAAAAIPVERSATTVDAALEDLRTGGYAINVHQSVDDIGTYLACGNLSGAVDESSALVVGLGELNDSGHSGVAVLREQGEQTDVTVYLTEAVSGDPAAASAETADDGTAAEATDAIMVDIRDFTYIPDPVEIPVGATVTWTNGDAAPHTATAEDRAVLQSGTLDTGESFSQTFAEPGTFDYFCEFHANMKGTVVVQ